MRPVLADSWDDFAEEWDQNASVRDYAEHAFTSLNERFDLHHKDWRTKRVLDFGCGTGILAEKMAPLVGEILATDNAPKMVMALQRKAISNVTAVCADLDDDTVRAGKAWFSDFDLIVASSVCGFLPDYEATLKLLSGALKNGGGFVQWDWLASEGGDFGLPVERVRRALLSAGLTEVQVETPFQLVMQVEERPVLMAYGVVEAIT